jgi:hypothetical protein
MKTVCFKYKIQLQLTDVSKLRLHTHIHSMKVAIFKRMGLESFTRFFLVYWYLSCVEVEGPPGY